MGRSGACPGGGPACRSGPAGRCRCRQRRSRPSARRGSWLATVPCPAVPVAIMVGAAHQCPSSPPSSPAWSPSSARLEGRAPAARRRHHQPQLPPADGRGGPRPAPVRPRRRGAGDRSHHRGDRLAPRRRRAHRAAGRRLPGRRAGARHALAARRRRRRSSTCAPRCVMAQVAAMLRRLHATPALPSAFAIFRLVEEQRALADGLPDSYDRLLRPARTESRRRPAGPEHVPGLLPQRPAHRQLRARRRARVHRRLGVRGDERPLLRPRQPVGQQRLRGRATTARCSSSTSTSR